MIAEIGVNHNGDVQLAEQLIAAAVKAGADAVKFQTFTAAKLVTSTATRAEYQIVNTGTDQTQLEMLRSLELSPAAHISLLQYCQQTGIDFLSTPFDGDAAHFLNDLGVSAFKVSSGDLTNLPLLELLNTFGKPVYLSTGMSDMEEVREAVQALLDVPLTLLHCTSNYPAALAEINLRAMTTLQREFGLPVGYSDHSPGTQVAQCAVALGAVVIEKHLTLDRELPGPDHKASLLPAEFAELVNRIRDTEVLLGDGVKQPMPSELATRTVARKSLVAARDIAKGAVLTAADITIKRPGNGILPKYLPDVIGRVATCDIAADALIAETDLR